MTAFVFRNGSRLTPYMLYQIERLNRDFKARWGLEIVVSSGIRLHQEQIDIFLERYVTAGKINGRKVYDTRVWNGVRYYRISSAGTVAVPGYSNHEIQGNTGAVDIRDTGNDAGVATWGSARQKWVAERAHLYDMDWEGRFFSEAWHYKMKNIFSAVPSGGGGTPIKRGKQVIYYHREDKTSRARGRVLAPGSSFWLNIVDKASMSQATNVVGGIGPYAITQHVYASGGTPGDAIDVQLYWDNTKTDGPHSGHYTQRFVFDKNGIINGSVTSQRAVAAGYAVYANMRAPKTNKSSCKIAVFDTDAYLIV